MSARQRQMTGSRDQRVTGSAVIVADIKPVDMPDGLTVAEQAAWGWLAPFAMQSGTLTPATAYGFALLCRNIVLEREMAMDPDKRGEASHRGVVQRIDAELARYMLAPMGKPLMELQAEPVDEWARFEVVAGGKA